MPSSSIHSGRPSSNSNFASGHQSLNCSKLIGVALGPKGGIYGRHSHVQRSRSSLAVLGPTLMSEGSTKKVGALDQGWEGVGGVAEGDERMRRLGGRL